jgi:hypothetical protein
MPIERKPGDVFLDRYMPNATPEERKVARENLYQFATALMRVAERLGQEDYECSIRMREGGGVELESGRQPPP